MVVRVFCGLICTEGLCISFIDIFALVGGIRLIHLLFKQNLIWLLVLIIYPPVKLSFCGNSALGILHYWNFHLLFLHWRLKILIWFNNQLFWISVHSRTNIFPEIQVSSFHTVAVHIFLHRYHNFLLYFFIIRCLHLAYSRRQQNMKWILW